MGQSFLGWLPEYLSMSWVGGAASFKKRYEVRFGLIKRDNSVILRCKCALKCPHLNGHRDVTMRNWFVRFSVFFFSLFFFSVFSGETNTRRPMCDVRVCTFFQLLFFVLLSGAGVVCGSVGSITTIFHAMWGGVMDWG